MATRGEVRGLLRTELDDAVTPYTWSDAQLNEYLTLAMLDYSAWLPLEKMANLSIVAGTASYGLPTDFRAPVRLEYPAGVLWLRDDRYSAPGSYRLFGGQLIFADPPSSADTAVLSYLANHALPAADGDTVTPNTQALVLFAAGLALRWLTTDEAKRVRTNRRALGHRTEAGYLEDYRRLLDALGGRRLRRR